MKHLCRINAYFVINIKALTKNKISFIWSVMLPFIMYVINQKNIKNTGELTYWWVYIVFNSFLYGVGLYALEMKEAGNLKMFFSVCNSNWNYFLGNLVTQIVYSVISIIIFNFVVIAIGKYNVTEVMIRSIVVIFFCIPIAFASYIFTFFEKIHAGTIRTIITILLFGMFLLIGTDNPLNRYNPMYFISDFFLNFNRKNFLYYIIFAAFCVGFGSMGINRFIPISNERR